MTTRITIVFWGVDNKNGIPLNKSACYISDENPFDQINFVLKEVLKIPYTKVKSVLLEEVKYD